MSAAKAFRDKQAAIALLRSWVTSNQSRLDATHPMLVAAIKGLAKVEAERIVASGRDEPIYVKPTAIDEAKRRLVTQLRRHRHGALHDVKSTEEWLSQCQAIATELGFAWPVQRKEAA